MLEKIIQVISDVSQFFKDSRVHVFDVEIAFLDEKELSLSGKVLEEGFKTQLHHTLADHFPGLEINDELIKVLRDHMPFILYVSTNLTGLYREPSFQSELISEVLLGWRVEVLEQRGRWCFIRLEDGYLGWVYRRYLSSQENPPATHLITASYAPIHTIAEQNSQHVTRLFSGTAVCIDRVDGKWGHVDGSPAGWLEMAYTRPIAQLPIQTTERQSTIVADAKSLMGVPYLWGGCTANGIDCSGFAQLLYRWVGIKIPRDADMQYATGQIVEPPYQPGDLLFFSGDDPRGISHVAISLGGWEIIHSSRSNNGVYCDNVQSVSHLKEHFSGARRFI